MATFRAACAAAACIIDVLRTEAPRGRLTVHLLPDQPVGHTLRFTEELRTSSMLALRNHGLTVRECEVLHWIAAGKRDGEIATILGLTQRTASKHAENLRRKLCAHTRLGAVHAAGRWLKAG